MKKKIVCKKRILVLLVFVCIFIQASIVGAVDNKKKI